MHNFPIESFLTYIFHGGLSNIDSCCTSTVITLGHLSNWTVVLPVLPLSHEVAHRMSSFYPLTKQSRAQLKLVLSMRNIPGCTLCLKFNPVITTFFITEVN